MKTYDDPLLNQYHDLYKKKREAETEMYKKAHEIAITHCPYKVGEKIEIPKSVPAYGAGTHCIIKRIKRTTGTPRQDNRWRVDAQRVKKDGKLSVLTLTWEESDEY